jgi:hypothetical protein
VESTPIWNPTANEAVFPGLRNATIPSKTAPSSGVNYPTGPNRAPSASSPEKHYTAARINRLLGRRGRFWEKDAFDHLVRSPEEFERLRRYITQNPLSAGLSPGEYAHYRRD